MTPTGSRTSGSPPGSSRSISGIDEPRSDRHAVRDTLAPSRPSAGYSRRCLSRGGKPMSCSAGPFLLSLVFVVTAPWHLVAAAPAVEKPPNAIIFLADDL